MKRAVLLVALTGCCAAQGLTFDVPTTYQLLKTQHEECKRSCLLFNGSESNVGCQDACLVGYARAVDVVSDRVDENMRRVFGP